MRAKSPVSVSHLACRTSPSDLSAMCVFLFFEHYKDDVTQKRVCEAFLMMSLAVGLSARTVPVAPREPRCVQEK